MEEVLTTPHAETPARRRHVFTPEEDNVIRHLISRHGLSQWDKIASRLPGRTGRQVRDRWRQHLAPQVSLFPWTPEEDSFLLHLVENCGPRWTSIIRFFPGRTDSGLKHRWNQLQRRAQRLGEENDQEEGDQLANAMDDSSDNSLALID
jgi:hypothetical protein